MNRRIFLRRSIIGGALLSLQSILNCQKTEKRINSTIARRKLGKTGERLSIIGFGGIVVRDIDQKLADNAVWKTPYLYPSGVDCVIVNGKIVIEKGEHTGRLPGKALRSYNPI